MIRIDHPDQLGGALTEMRKARGLSRRTLAEQAEMKDTQYGTYENGHRVPNAETLLRLADAANHDVILIPREIATALIDLANAIPFNALAALASLQQLDPGRTA